MKSNRNITYFLSNLREKHRLSLRDQHNDKEVWYMHISPLAVIASFIALVLVLFIIIISVAAYTPVLDMVPGHPGNRSREMLIQNINRIDSLERQLEEIQIYTTNVALIMSGKVPVTRNVGQSGDSLRSAEARTAEPNQADSILRSQMEGSGAYSLASAASAQKSRFADINFIAPVRGVVTRPFSPKDGNFGIGIVTSENQEVVAVTDGTVIVATWTPNEGYVIQIQHANNMISIYRQCTRIMKTVGTRVKTGEVIGYAGQGISGAGNNEYFDFELWYDGTPVDPESYITF